MKKKQVVKDGQPELARLGARARLDQESEALIGKWKAAAGPAPGIVTKKREVVNPYAAAGKKDNRQDARNRKVAKLMRRKVRKNDNPYVWSIGYNNCSARYTRGDVATLSGSSLNRKINQKDNSEKKKNFPDIGKRASIEALRKSGITYLGLLGIGCAYIAEGQQGIAPSETEDSDGEGGHPVRLPASISQSELLLRIPAFKLSSRSRVKVRDKITAFFRASGKQRTFATLSFIEKVDDGTAVEILNKFLTQMRKQFATLQYIWVAERQEENVKFPGNIHFHMLLNKFLPVGRWNALWVLAQYNSGLVGHRENGDVISYEEILDLWKKDEAAGFEPTCINPKTGKKRTHIQEVLNPFDVRAVKNVSQLSAYVTKYVTGQGEDVYFACRPWHCSRGVSRLFTRQLTSPSTFRYLRSLANIAVSRTTGEIYEPRVLTGPFWVTVYVVNKRAPLPFLKEMERVNRWQLEGMNIDALTRLTNDSYRKIHRQEESSAAIDPRGDCFWRKDYTAYQQRTFEQF